MPVLRGRATLFWLPLAVLAVLIAWPVAQHVRAADGEPRLVVGDLRADELILFDGAEVTGRIPLPGGIHEMLELPDGRLVVSIEQRGLLALVDLERSAVTEIAVGGIPHGLALDGGVLLVTDRASSEVRRFDVDSWRELSPIATGEWPHAVAVADGSIVVAAARSDELWIGDQVFAVSAVPETVDVSADGAIATAGATGGELQVFAGDGAELLRVFLGGRPVRVRFSPDGTEIAVALSAAGEVALVDRSGDVRRVPVPGVPDGLAWDPSGDRLYASDVVGGTVAVLNGHDLSVVGVIEGGTATGAILVR